MSTKSTTIPSAVLLDGIRQGSQEAWRKLFDRYYPVVLRTARWSRLHKEDAEDVAMATMEAFLDSYRANRYDRQRGRLTCWIGGIAANKIREAHRRLAARREVQVVDRDDKTPGMNRILDERSLTKTFTEEREQAILAECLRRVRQEVKPKTFAAFNLFARKGWPAARVASHLGITKEAVYVCKSRVLGRMIKLRKEIEKDW